MKIKVLIIITLLAVSVFATGFTTVYPSGDTITIDTKKRIASVYPDQVTYFRFSLTPYWSFGDAGAVLHDDNLSFQIWPCTAPKGTLHIRMDMSTNSFTAQYDSVQVMHVYIAEISSTNKTSKEYLSRALRVREHGDSTSFFFDIPTDSSRYYIFNLTEKTPCSRDGSYKTSVKAYVTYEASVTAVKNSLVINSPVIQKEQRGSYDIMGRAVHGSPRTNMVFVNQGRSFVNMKGY